MNQKRLFRTLISFFSHAHAVSEDSIGRAAFLGKTVARCVGDTKKVGLCAYRQPKKGPFLYSYIINYISSFFLFSQKVGSFCGRTVKQWG